MPQASATPTASCRRRDFFDADDVLQRDFRVVSLVRLPSDTVSAEDVDRTRYQGDRVLASVLHVQQCAATQDHRAFEQRILDLSACHLLHGFPLHADRSTMTLAANRVPVNIYKQKAV